MAGVQKPVLMSNVNPYWFQEHFDGKALEFLSEMMDALKGDKYFDHTDIQTDYFHCSHYVEIKIGRWDTPYILTKWIQDAPHGAFSLWDA